MPCSESPAEKAYYDSKELERSVEKSTNTLEKKVDFLTDLLCELCSKQETLSGALGVWYENHIKADKARVITEFNLKIDRLSGSDWRKIEVILDNVK